MATKKTQEPKPIKLCQYCDAVIESQRGKNCIKCSQINNDAYECKTYGAVQTAFHDGRGQGLRGVELQNYVLDQQKAEVKAQQQRAEARRKAEIQQQALRDDRRVTNDILRAGGYRWRKHGNDEEYQDRFDLPSVEWFLQNASGDVVTVREAMDQMAAKGSERAARWLAEHPKQ